MKKKIAILLPNLCGGGAERVAVNLANEFIARGHSVDLVLLKALGVYMPEVNQNVNIVDLQVPRIRSAIIPLIDYIKSNQPDAMIANMWPLTGIAIIAKFLAWSKVRMMIVEHINWVSSMKDYSSKFNYITKYGMRWLFPIADVVVVVSNGAADDLSALCNMPRINISTIYNPIVGSIEVSDDGQFHLPSWWIGNHKRLIAIGSFKKQKNYPLLLQAFSIITKKIDAKLLILGDGDGDTRAILESNVNALGLTGSVFLPGFAVNPSTFLRHADLFVLSSDFEGFGNVVVEALQAGTPVVSTDCPSGPSEILENGVYGILTPVGDPQAMADAMLNSLSRSHDSEALRARSLEFTVEKSADAYLNLLFPAEST